MKHIYVCWKAIYKYKAYLCNSNCKAILTLASILEYRHDYFSIF